MTQNVNQLQGISDAVAPLGAEDEMFARRNYHTYTGWFTDNDTAAGDQTEETLVKLDATKFPNGAKLVAAYVAPGIAVTGHDTTNKVVTFRKMTSAGASAATLAVLTTNVATGNFAANQAKAATITAANADIPVGGLVTYVVTHGSTGVKTNGAVTVTGKTLVQVVLKAI